MKWGDSVKEKLGSWFKEASELMKRNQCLFIHRAVYSQNKTVREVSMATRKMETSRVWNSIKFIGEFIWWDTWLHLRLLSGSV